MDWYESFSAYMVATGEDASDDQKKMALLLCCLGREGQAQYRSIRDNPLDLGEELISEFDSMVARLAAHFDVKKGRTASRFEFEGRRRRFGEHIQEFAADLFRLSTRCSYEDYSREAVKDRLIIG